MNSEIITLNQQNIARANTIPLLQRIFDDDPPQEYLFEVYKQNHEIYAAKQTQLWSTFVSIAISANATINTIIARDNNEENKENNNNENNNEIIIENKEKENKNNENNKNNNNNKEKIEGGGVYIAYNSKNIPSVFQYIKGGFWKTFFQWKLNVFKRVLDFGNITEDAHHRIMGNKEHIYLLAIGVDPDRQGHGYGGKLLSHLLQRVDEQKLECYLECTKQKNISFYEHFGFIKVEDLKVGADPHAPIIFLMRRPSINSQNNNENNDENNNEKNEVKNENNNEKNNENNNNDDDDDNNNNNNNNDNINDVNNNEKNEDIENNNREVIDNNENNNDNNNNNEDNDHADENENKSDHKDEEQE